MDDIKTAKYTRIVIVVVEGMLKEMAECPKLLRRSPNDMVVEANVGQAGSPDRGLNHSRTSFASNSGSQW